MTKLLLSVVCLLAIAQEVMAAEESVSTMQIPKSEVRSILANINKSNIEAGGDFSLFKDTTGGKPSLFLNPFFRYFVINSFSVGAVTEFQFGEAYSRLGAGPSLAYYFAQTGKAAFFVGEDFLITQTKESYSHSTGSGENTRWIEYSTTRVGMNYFIIPGVAVGPSINFKIPMGDGMGGSQDFFNGYFELKGQFSVYF